MKLSDFLISAGGGGISEAQMTAYVDPSLLERDASITWLFDNTLNIDSLDPYATNASIGLAGFAKQTYVDNSLATRDASISYSIERGIANMSFSLSGLNVNRVDTTGFSINYSRFANVSTNNLYVRNIKEGSIGYGIGIATDNNFTRETSSGILFQNFVTIDASQTSSTFGLGLFTVPRFVFGGYNSAGNRINTAEIYIENQGLIEGSEYAKMHFRTKPSSGAQTTAITIDASQRVGFGTTNPSTAFHLYGTGGTVPVFKVSGPGEQSWQVYNTNPTGAVTTSLKFASRHNPDWTWVWGTDDSNAGQNDFWLLNRVGGAKYVIYCASNGNIILGDSNTPDYNPAARLSVIGDVSIGSGILSVRKANAAGLGGELNIINSNSAFVTNNRSVLNFGLSGSASGGLTGAQAQIKAISMDSTSETDLIFSTSNDTSLSDRMKLDSAGTLYLNTVPNASTSNLLYYNTTSKAISYGAAPSADISTLGIESYVNSSTYYDGSLMYQRMPNPSTGLNYYGAQGTYVNLVAGENITANYAVCIRPDGKAWHTRANASDYMPAVALNMTGATVTAGNSADFLIHGVAKVANATYFQAGKPVYVYDGVNGYIYYQRPTAVNSCVQVLGIAISNNSMIWNPSPDFVVLK